MHQNIDSPSLEEQVLSSVNKLLELNSNNDSARQELARSILLLNQHVEQIKLQNTQQTEQLNKVEVAVIHNSRELDVLKAETMSNLKEIRLDVKTVTSDLSSHMKDEAADIKRIYDKVASADTKMNTVIEAFPHTDDDKPDFRTHRLDHDTIKDEKVTWNRRKDKIYDHVISGIAWAAIVGVGLAIWEYLKVKLGGGG